MDKAELQAKFKLDSIKMSNVALSQKRKLTKEEIEGLKNFTKADGFSMTGTKYHSKKQYDSVIRNSKEKPGWLKRTLVYREIELNEKYKDDKGKIVSAFLDDLLHRFPQILFVSLPLFALILQMLYARKKQYFYTNHLIFTIHLYIFVFIVLLAVIGLRELNSYVDWYGISWIIGLLYAFIFYYEYKALRNFYQQRRAKTILKYVILNTLHLVVVIILFSIFTLVSLLKI